MRTAKFKNTNDIPLRVSRAVAMEILGVDRETFRKILEVNPQLAHRIPGEVRAKYLTRELFALLKPVPGVQSLGGGPST